MMARRGVLGVLAGGAAALLSGCGLFGGNSYRYKLTVEVETPEGLRTGYAVRQVDWSPGVKITPEADTASMTHKGEAVMVELPNGETLFALMSPDGQETPMLAFGSATLKSIADRSVKELRPPERFNSSSGRSGYPRFVRFRNINDPKTVENVDPAKLATSFGAGYRLKRITAQIVDEDVTQKVVKKLPWIEEYKKKRVRLSGKSGAMFVSDDLADELGTGDFAMGTQK
jgi:hypothetical protein